MFEAFALHRIDTEEATILARIGGSGPPLLLLHGNPQTHVMWHKIAPRLAEHFTVVAADLRGYGGSSKPSTTPDHEPYSKRAMARDQIAVMRHFGFERFSVVGHDRGGRCRLSHGARSSRENREARGPRYPADARALPAHRHGVRDGLLALVLSAAALSAAGDDDRRRSGMVLQAQLAGRERAAKILRSRGA